MTPDRLRLAMLALIALLLGAGAHSVTPRWPGCAGHGPVEGLFVSCGSKP